MKTLSRMRECRKAPMGWSSRWGMQQVRYLQAVRMRAGSGRPVACSVSRARLHKNAAQARKTMPKYICVTAKTILPIDSEIRIELRGWPGCIA